MRLVNVQATFEEDQAGDEDGWHLEFTVPIDKQARFQGVCQTYGYSIHGKNRHGRWLVDALRIQPVTGQLKGKLDAWVDAFSSDGKERHYFTFPQPLMAGNRFVFGVDDDYVFRITSVSELTQAASDLETIGASQ